ncbi:MAG: AmmeMemoRadiSam system protein B [Methanobrevibacter sp.]|jgi:AmmeMemoRadiSam system protein B|nr:AmmeMemoRadiSam system protein B [Methanobrevibacter sp.]
MLRKSAIAGSFYDNDPNKLKKTIEECFNHRLGPGNIPKLGGSKKVSSKEVSSKSSPNEHPPNKQHNKHIYGSIIPHAGYVYSGSIAAHAYYKLVETGFPKTFIILCPNHTGLGTGISIYDKGSWETPLGTVDIDEEFANSLISNSDIITPDTSAHMREHSCEIHLPFLQYFSNDFKIVPIVMWMQDMESAKEIGKAIAKTVKSNNEISNNEIKSDKESNSKYDISVIASTDLTHYQPQEIANNQDKLILDSIANMDEFTLMKNIKEFNISMCGYGPVIATMESSRLLGAKKAKILKYATSGDISGDFSSVVGYGSAIFE